MRYLAYPKYRGSGVEWLGDVPEHWQVKPLSYLARFVGGATPDKSTAEYWDGEIPWVSPKDMKRPRICDAEDHVSLDGLRNSALSMIPRSAVLVVVRGMILAHSFPVALTEAAVTINQDMKALLSDKQMTPTFLFWALSGSSKAIVSLADESAHGTRKLETSILGRFPLLVPPIPEQRTIADVLDAQTTKLDALVAKKRTLIEKLKERRVALISRAVMRGLSSDAAHAAAGRKPCQKARPTDVDWFSQVPQHWEVIPLRRFTRFITSGSRGWAEHYANEGAIFVRIGNLTRDSIRVDLSDVQRVDPPPGAEGERTRIQIGDVLFSITAYLGSVAVATDSIAGGYINQHIALARLDTRRLLPRFAAYAALADIGQAQLTEQAYGGTKIQLALDDVASLKLPIPPLAEQLAIADYLDRETAKIDRMVATVEQAIERLQEYRAALITAAVTGRIDVRGVGRDDAALALIPSTVGSHADGR